MNALKIIAPPSNGKITTGNGTKVLLPDGTEVPNIARVTVSMARDEIMTAVIEVAVAEVENVEAHPLLGLETVQAAAEKHGFVLVEKAIAEKVMQMIDFARSLDEGPAPDPVVEDAVAVHKKRTL